MDGTELSRLCTITAAQIPRPRDYDVGDVAQDLAVAAIQAGSTVLDLPPEYLRVWLWFVARRRVADLYRRDHVRSRKQTARKAGHRRAALAAQGGGVVHVMDGVIDPRSQEGYRNVEDRLDLTAELAVLRGVLSERDYAVVQAIMQNPGLTLCEVAAVVGISRHALLAARRRIARKWLAAGSSVAQFFSNSTHTTTGSHD